MLAPIPIVAWNGIPLGTREEFAGMLRQAVVGQSIMLTIARDGVSLPIKVTHRPLPTAATPSIAVLSPCMFLSPPPWGGGGGGFLWGGEVQTPTPP